MSAPPGPGSQPGDVERRPKLAEKLEQTNTPDWYYLTLYIIIIREARTYMRRVRCVCP